MHLQGGHEAVVEVLLCSGVNVDHPDEDGITALWSACQVDAPVSVTWLRVVKGQSACRVSQNVKGRQVVVAG